MTTKKQKIIVVLGPTATGKSDLAVYLAKEFNGEVISADSRQVYKGLNIGSGKITKKEMCGVKHYLLDVVKPQTIFSAESFRKKARKAVEEIAEKGKVPIVAGGTAFYIDTLVKDSLIPEVKPDKKLRRKLEKKSLKELQSMLYHLDRRRYMEIDKDNPVRLVRGIEIARALGKVPKTEYKPSSRTSSIYDVLYVGIDWDDKVLKKRIYDRLVKRMGGIVREVKRLHKEGLSWKRMDALGLEYRYIPQYVRGEIGKEEVIEVLSSKIWQFAKRQRRWFKRNAKVKWFKPTEKGKIKKVVRDFLGGR